MFTCGGDGDARIWDGIDDDEPESHRVGDLPRGPTAIAYYVRL